MTKKVIEIATRCE